MTVTVRGGTMCTAEQQAYVEEMRRRHPDKIFTEMTLTIEGDEIRVDYTYEPVPFERIRRITGYLVGTLDRFNNAKRREVDDRVLRLFGGSCRIKVSTISTVDSFLIHFVALPSRQNAANVVYCTWVREISDTIILMLYTLPRPLLSRTGIGVFSGRYAERRKRIVHSTACWLPQSIIWLGTVLVLSHFYVI